MAVFILDMLIRIIIHVDGVLLIGLMELGMKVSGKIVNLMVKASYCLKMEIHMKGNGRKTRLMDMAY